MNNILKYKGYTTKVQYDNSEQILYGKIEGISDLITFETENIKDVEKEFHDAVDDYLEMCKEVGKNPDKEYGGVFNVRISPDLHKKLALVAITQNTTINSLVEQSIKSFLKDINKAEMRSSEAINYRPNDNVPEIMFWDERKRM